MSVVNCPDPANHHYFVYTSIDLNTPDVGSCGQAVRKMYLYHHELVIGSAGLIKESDFDFGDKLICRIHLIQPNY